MEPHQIYALTGVKKGTVRNLARKAGVIRPKGGRSELSRREKQEAEHLYVNCSHSCRQVAEILRQPVHRISHYLRTKGVTRSIRKARRAKYSTKKTRAYIMFKKGMKQRHIARRLGLSEHTIWDWKNKYSWEELESTTNN